MGDKLIDKLIAKLKFEVINVNFKGQLIGGQVETDWSSIGKPTEVDCNRISIFLGYVANHLCGSITMS